MIDLETLKIKSSAYEFLDDECFYLKRIFFITVQDISFHTKYEYNNLEKIKIDYFMNML